MTPSVASRSEWLDLLCRLISPVLTAAADGSLDAVMPVETHPDFPERQRFATLEAVVRCLLGAAPWLEHDAEDPAEAGRQAQYRAMAQRALDTMFAPEAGKQPPVTNQKQPLVEAGLLVSAIQRAPQSFWTCLSSETQGGILDFLNRALWNKPSENNLVLFRGMAAAFATRHGIPLHNPPMLSDLDTIMGWYKGDGFYGDGEQLAFDYYNSFVIHPLALELRDMLATDGHLLPRDPDPIDIRAGRMAQILERMIAPDGSFPPLGRSIAYRCGAFHLLALLAWRRSLPGTLPPAQVREALNAVILRTLGAPGTFDEGGWLRIGLAGHQPELGESYINTGSLYFCTTAFLPLGLPPSDPFWADAPLDWTSKRVWSGEIVPADTKLQD